nr:MAG TPA: hypothetical protein [Caudoviricetes sp.]
MLLAPLIFGRYLIDQKDAAGSVCLLFPLLEAYPLGNICGRIAGSGCIDHAVNRLSVRIDLLPTTGRVHYRRQLRAGVYDSFHLAERPRLVEAKRFKNFRHCGIDCFLDIRLAHLVVCNTIRTRRRVAGGNGGLSLIARFEICANKLLLTQGKGSVFVYVFHSFIQDSAAFTNTAPFISTVK